MKNERYYYGILSKEEKAAYRMIYNGIKMRALNIVVPVYLPPKQIQDVYLKVLYDNPIFYYINQTVIRMTGEAGYYILLPEYLYTNNEIEKINQDIQNVLRRIDVKARTMLSNEFRLEKYLHDSVVKSVAYDYDSLQKNDCYNAHSIVGAFLDKKAVCEGIAKAFKLLCNEYSMKCIVVLGKADPEGKFDGDTYHAWNLVKVGNGSYHIDETIYDILPVSQLLCDILTVFSRDYVVSGPVWEYYSSNNDEWAIGLKRELKYDVLNGFVGKTVIHPNQIPVVVDSLKVKKQDYDDAMEILSWRDDSALLVGGSAQKERMNEVNTHLRWAKRVASLAAVYGVQND